MTNPDFGMEAPEHIVEAIATIESHSPALWKDLGSYLQTVTMLTEHERSQLATEVPEDYNWQYNTQLSVVDPHFVGFKTAQRFGSGLLLVGPEGDGEQRIVDADEQVAVYTPATHDFDWLDELTDERHTANPDPDFDLLTGSITSTPNVSYLRGDRTAHIMMKPENLQICLENGSVERMFMTLLLKEYSRKLQSCLPDDSDFVPLSEYMDREGPEMTAYQQLTEVGQTPFGIEDLYGMMAAVYSRFRDRHPEKFEV